MWSNLIRIFRTLDLVSRSQGATKKEIMDATELSERSFYRLIAALEDMGIPLYEERHDGEREKNWHVDPDYLKKLPNISIPDPNFSFPEIFVLSFLKNYAVIFQNTELARYADSSFQKLKNYIPEKLMKVFDRIEAAFVSRNRFTKNYAGYEEILDKILSAIIAGKKCLIQYNSFKSCTTKEYMVNPLHFFEENGGFYLIVQVETTGIFNIFAVERIVNVKILSETFTYPLDFNARDYLNESFGIIMDEYFECRVHFSSEVTPYIKERSWSNKQRIEIQPDGSVILEMQTCGWLDVKRWILSFGKYAHVLAPEKMRHEIIEDISIIHKKYQSNP